MPAMLTEIVLGLHIGAGAAALIAGTIAISLRKGGRLHRASGNWFTLSMLIMAISAIYLGVVLPGQFINVLIGTFAVYLISTAWLTVRHGRDGEPWPERILFAVAVCLCAPFVVLSLQVALGFAPFFKSAIPFKGPVLIALYAFTSILTIAAAADARVVFGGALTGVPRLSRHLWRMCLGLAMAAGSGFTNGLARLLPGPYHVPMVFFLPQFIPVLLLFYWMVRVRFTGWRRRRVVVLT